MNARETLFSNSLSGRQSGLKRTGISRVLFKPTTLIALLAIALFSFGALMVLSGFAKDFRKTTPAQATPRSVSAVGYKPLRDYMKANGFLAPETRGNRPYYEKHNRLVILTPARPYSRLNRDVKNPEDNEIRLIILPKWSVAEMRAQKGEEARQDWARKTSEDGLHRLNNYNYLLDDMPVVKRVENISQNINIEFHDIKNRNLPDTSKLDIDSLQYFDLETRWLDYRKLLRELREIQKEAERKKQAEERGETYEPPKEKKSKKKDNKEEEIEKKLDPLPEYDVIMRIDGHPVLIRLKDSRTFLMSEPDLLNTMAFQTQTGARLALGVVDEVLIESEAEFYHADFDVSLHGIEENRNIIKLMVTPPFLAATLCLLLAGGLIGWQGFNRFGDPISERPDYAQGPVSLAETAAEFMEVANRTQHTGAAYADLVRRQVIEQLGFKGRSESAVETLLDSREKRLEISPNFAALKQSISNANPQSYGAYARALTAWRNSMIKTETTQKDSIL